MNTRPIYIEGKHIRSFEELKLLFDSPEAKIPGSRLYLRLIDLAIDSALADFFQSIGRAEMAEKIRALDTKQSDLQIMNELQRIITGGAVDISFDPLAFVRVLKTSIVKCEHAVQTCFEIQILKAVKEILLFSVVCGEEEREEQLNLDIYLNGEIVNMTQELPESVGEVSFLINGKEVSRECIHYNVTFLCDIPDASLLVDGKQIASSFPITQELPYGSHTIRVLCAGYRTFEEVIMVRDNHECSIVLEKRLVSVGDILCTDDTTMPCSEWPVYGKTAKGVVFYVDDSGYHGWAVHLRNQGEYEWAKLLSTTNKKLVPGLSLCSKPESALADMDGYSNTKIIRSQVNSILSQFSSDPTGGNLTAMTLSGLKYLSLVSEKKLPGKTLDITCKFPAVYAVNFANGWYLPSCGQLMMLIDRRDEVNDSLAKTDGHIIGHGFSYWSSTQADAFYAWYVDNCEGVLPGLKSSTQMVRSIRNF